MGGLVGLVGMGGAVDSSEAKAGGLKGELVSFGGALLLSNRLIGLAAVMGRSFGG